MRIESLITRRDLERLAHHMTIWHWAREPDFPRPVWVIGRTELYSAPLVLEWLEKHGKMTPAQRFELETTVEGRASEIKRRATAQVEGVRA